MYESSFTTKKEEPPSCYGKQWDPSASECSGGPDTQYTHPKTGSHIREQCDFYNSCGARVQAARMGAPLIPAASLMRPPTQGIPLGPIRTTQTSAGPSFRQFMQPQRPAYAPPQQQPQYVQQTPVHTPAGYPPQQHQQAGHPAPTYQLQYMIPAYLSVPEQRLPNSSFWGLLSREAVRSVGKSLGHTIAHFFDFQPLRPPQE